MQIIITLKGLPIKEQLIICETLETYIKEKTNKDVFSNISYICNESNSFTNNEKIKK
nr:MAG TPA: hypothetical protein [Caudoviricetes sp.]